MFKTARRFPRTVKRSAFAVIVAVLSVLMMAGCTAGASRSPTASIPATGVAGLLTGGAGSSVKANALMGLLKELHVGVYRRDGSVVHRGDERGPRDGYLYDFEVDLLARAASEKPTRTVGDVTNALQAMLAPDGLGAPNADAVSRELSVGVREAAARPADAGSLVRLLVRDLVRVGAGFDLAALPQSDQALFNRLTYWLIIADLSFGLLARADVSAMAEPRRPSAGITTSRRSGSAGDASIAPASLTGAASTAAQRSDRRGAIAACGKIGASGGREVWTGFGKWAVTLFDKVSKVVKGALVAADALHGVILAYGVDVRVAEDRVGPAHYGHGGSGRPIDLRAQVVMQDDLPDALVQCGWLLGVTWPKPGPMSGVGVNVGVGDSPFGAEAALSRHGDARCLNECVTDADGWVVLRFTPAREQDPAAAGSIKEEHFVVHFAARYQAAHKNYLGQPWQWAKLGSTRLIVEWHEPGPTLIYEAAITQDHTTVGRTGCDVAQIRVSTRSKVSATVALAVSRDGTHMVGNGVLAYESAEYAGSNRGSSCLRHDTSKKCAYRVQSTLLDTTPGRLLVTTDISLGPDGMARPVYLKLEPQDLWESYRSVSSAPADCSVAAPPLEYRRQRFISLFDSAHPTGRIADWTDATSSTDSSAILLTRARNVADDTTLLETIKLMGLRTGRP